MKEAQGRILVVDDDPYIREVVGDRIEAQGFEVITASDGEEGLRRIRTEALDLVLLDLQLPAMDGMAVLRRIREEQLDTTVVVITAYGSIERAVEAMKAGAFDFISKPFEPERIRVVVEKAVERDRLRREHAFFREQADSIFPALIADSPRMQPLLTIARKAAESTATVLLIGESGTGKEVLARVIHRWSPRREHAFVAVNCVALAESLLESELFGHEKGAFTSAIRQKKGKFEVARGGTIFLDEIGATKREFQFRLLRVLQEGEFERVGGDHVLKANVRVIASTSRNLEQAIAEGAFLSDLYYRLNVVSIALPPLRERKEDIPLLANFFLRKYAHETKREVAGISDGAMACLLAHAWPGNIRELENAIERAVVLGAKPEIQVEDLPDQVVRKTPSVAEAAPASDGLAWIQTLIRDDHGNPEKNLLDIAEERVLRAVMAHVQGNKTQAARLLGIHRKKVERRLAKYGIVPFGQI